MTANVSARVIDNGLAVLDTEPDRLFICSAEPTTYAQASTNGAFRLGQKTFSAGAFFGAPQAGTADGRKVSSIAFSDGLVTTTGTATHWAVCDSVNTRLLATGTLAAPTAVVNSATFGLPSFSVQVSVSMGLAISGVTLTASVLATASPAFGSAVLNAEAVGWKTLKVGAGGLLTGLDIVPDGTVACRADTYGGYIYERTEPNPGNAGGLGAWRQVVTTLSISGLLTTTPHSEDGVTELRIAPSNSNILYMAFMRRLWRSANRGMTWTELTSFTPIDEIVGNTGAQRTYQYKMAIDPVNPDHVVYMSRTHGGFRTTNGGTTWPAISGLAASSGAISGDPTDFVNCVAFGIDPSGGTTQTIYLSVSGTGVYRSTNGGTSFSLITSTPTRVTDMKVSADGTLWVVDKFATGKLWSYNGTSWTDRSTTLPLGTNVETITCHPTLAARLVCFSYNNGGCYTINTGATWTAPNPNAAMVATDCPWLADLYITPGTLTNGLLATVWDPLDTTKLWTGCQQGIWNIDVPLALSPTPITFTSRSSGIEQLVGSMVLCPPGGVPLMAHGDCGLIRRNATNMLTTYPNDQAWYPNDFLNFGVSADYAKTDPTFVAAVVGWESGLTQDFSGYSASGGAVGTWSLFGGKPYNSDNVYYGTIACQSPTNMVRAQGNAYGGLCNTTNGGATWVQCSIPGVCGTCFGNTTSAYSSGATALTSMPDVNGLVANGWISVNYTLYQIASVVGSTVNLVAPGLTSAAAAGSFYFAQAGWSTHPFFYNRHNLCCDDGGTYYITNYSPTGQGVYSSPNGSTWTRVSTTAFDVGTNAQMAAVPGNNGHLFFIQGSSGSGGDPASAWPHNIPFYHSTNGGVTWVDVSNLSNTGSGNQFTIREVWCFALGAVAPGKSYPTIYIYGWLAAGASAPAAGTQPGFYRSFDHGITWEQFGSQHPVGWFDSPSKMDASRTVHPLVFVTTHNSGYYYYG